MLKLIDIILSLPLINKLKPFYEKNKTALLYIYFGALTTLVNFVVYFTVRHFGLSEKPSIIIAWICAVSFAYITNKIYVFDSKTDGKAEFLREISAFFGARIFSLLVEIVIMDIFFERLGFNELIIKIAANVVVLLLNYILSKVIVFKKKK